MRKLRTQEQIMSQWVGDFSKPLVSICCLTYNHGNFIDEAIQGFLIQETEFPFEIIVHDDASNDNTQEIIEKYHKKYPKLIKPIFQFENKLSKGEAPLFLIAKKALGDFLAFCEGDDYWVDSNKLQIQIRFLSENPSFSVCSHEYYESNGKLIDKKFPPFDTLTQMDYARLQSFIQTSTIVLRRNEFINSVPEKFQNFAKSSFYFLRMADFGDIKFLKRKMSVYRLHSGGMWALKSRFEQGKMRLSHMEFMMNFYKNKRKLATVLRKHYLKVAVSYTCHFFWSLNFHRTKYFLRLAKKYSSNRKLVFYFFSKIILDFFSKIKKKALLYYGCSSHE